MSNILRFWLFAVTVLLLTEDFQYLLKIENPACGQAVSEKMADCPDEEEGKDGNKEKKEDKKEKDDDNNVDSGLMIEASALLARNIFSDAHAPISALAHELESPPPEV